METTLISCNFANTHDCGHSEDAGVVCSSGGLFHFLCHNIKISVINVDYHLYVSCDVMLFKYRKESLKNELPLYL